MKTLRTFLLCALTAGLGAAAVLVLGPEAGGQPKGKKKEAPPASVEYKSGIEWPEPAVVTPGKDTGPRFEADGKLAKPAIVTVLQNGIVVQNHFELLGGTFYDKPAAYTPHPPKAPIHLQFHGNPVMFRNIWVRELKEIVGKPPAKKD